MVNGHLLTPRTSGQGGFWTTFNWDQAFRLGAEDTGPAYSGKFDFAATEMYWPLSHMVATKDKALQCVDCHGEGGRMNWTALGYDGDPAFRGSRAPMLFSRGSEGGPAMTASLLLAICSPARARLAVRRHRPRMPARRCIPGSSCSTRTADRSSSRRRPGLHAPHLRELPRYPVHRRAQLPCRRRGRSPVRARPGSQRPALGCQLGTLRPAGTR